MPRMMDQSILDSLLSDLPANCLELVRKVEYITHRFHRGARCCLLLALQLGAFIDMSKISVDEDLKPNEVFVEDAEAQSRDLGT